MKKLLLIVQILLLSVISGNFIFAENRNRNNFDIIHLMQFAKNTKHCERARIKTVELIQHNTLCLEMDLYTGKYPVTLDFVYKKNYQHRIKKIIYLVAPAGLNFKSTFLTPLDENMAKYLSEQGYLVIGVSFPENRIPEEEAIDIVADWGLEKHRKDLEKVVRFVQRRLPYHYDMLGQASSAVTIMDFAAHNNGKLDTIILLDTDSFDPVLQPDKVQYAQITYDALTQLISQGTTVDPFVKDFKNMVLAGYLYPEMDSGVSRDFLNLPGNFTLNGLLHFSIINTAFLPGIHTSLTNLPGEWVLIQGVGAGYYNFMIDPLEDQYTLYKTPVSRLVEMANIMGEGSMPLAVNRDIFAILSLNDSGYRIPWNGIQENVIMINGEYSSGDQTYYETLIKNAGNNHVVKYLINDYAYLDLLYGSNAKEDVWSLISTNHRKFRH